LRTVAPELDQPGLLGVQFQVELGQSRPQIRPESLGLPFVLEPDHKVVRVPHNNHVASCVTLSPLVGLAASAIEIRARLIAMANP